MPATPAWLAAVESLLGRAILGSAQARSLTKRLEGTALQVNLEGLASFQARVADGRLSLIAGDTTAPGIAKLASATITGTPLGLLNLARSGPKDGQSKVRTPVQIHGDAEIANLYRQLLAAAQPDLEDELSRLVGDFPARRLSQIARKTFGWLQKTRRTTGENIAEYLQEESRDLVSAPELGEFLQGVDMLRETADRVEARLAQLERRLKGSV
jgi:ubiquinone biosynthesis protein UbiJ